MTIEAVLAFTVTSILTERQKSMKWGFKKTNKKNNGIVLNSRYRRRRLGYRQVVYPFLLWNNTDLVKILKRIANLQPQHNKLLIPPPPSLITIAKSDSLKAMAVS